MACAIFSLIGHHLESIGRIEAVFELNLAPSEQRPTYEFLSDSGIFFIELSCYRHKLQPFCQGKGQRSHTAKNRRKQFLPKIGQAMSKLVAVLSGGSRGGGPGGPDPPPPFGPQCRLFNIGPQSWIPPFCECPRVGVFFNFFSDGG